MDNKMADPERILRMAISEFIKADFCGQYSQLKHISRMVYMFGTKKDLTRLCAFIWTEDGQFMLNARDSYIVTLEGVYMGDISTQFSRFLDIFLFSDQKKRHFH